MKFTILAIPAYEMIGWIGVGFYVSAYLLLTLGKMKSTDYSFHLLNILGAIGLIIDACYEQDRPNLAVNAIWLLIGLGAITRNCITTLYRRNRG